MMQMGPLRPNTISSLRRGFASSLLILSFLCSSVIACAEEPVEREKAPPPPIALEIMERAKREFQKARFYKPVKGDSSNIECKLAPLIVEEFDLVRSLEINTLVNPRIIDETSPLRPDTVYFYTGTISDGNKKLDEVAFVWWYEKPAGCIPWPLSASLLTRGVRIVLDDDGMPILWEALTDPSGPRIVFVSQAVELAAKQQVGEPLPGRSFSIERSHDDVSAIIVAGILDDGPVQMGPYVYVDASPQRAISTIHCRCSPSRFNEVVETFEYTLQPLESINAKWLHEQGGIDVKKLMDSEPLEKLFRWPKM